MPDPSPPQPSSLTPVLTPDQLTALARARYSTKAYDPARRVPDAEIEALLELLRHAPSSVNAQPWHFVLAATPEARARIAGVLQGRFAYNAAKVANASHVLVLCARPGLEAGHLDTVLAQEAADGRFKDDAARATQAQTRGGYVEPHRDAGRLPHWVEKQVYLGLGTLLLGAAALGIDATPMEGFDPETLDAELGLPARGLTSLVLVALGYRAETDFNARLPKSRLPAAAVVTRL